VKLDAIFTYNGSADAGTSAAIHHASPAQLPPPIQLNLNTNQSIKPRASEYHPISKKDHLHYGKKYTNF
jgi:hypothetical protein